MSTRNLAPRIRSRCTSSAYVLHRDPAPRLEVHGHVQRFLRAIGIRIDAPALQALPHAARAIDINDAASGVVAALADRHGSLVVVVELRAHEVGEIAEVLAEVLDRALLAEVSHGISSRGARPPRAPSPRSWSCRCPRRARS